MTDEVRHRRQVEDVGFAMLYHILTLDKDLSDGAFRLYALLLKYAQRKKHALPGLDRLGKELGKTRVTISRLMAELAGKGLITRQRRFGTSSITWIEDLNEIYKDVLAQMDDGNKNDTIVEGNKDDTKERGDCIKNNTSNVTGMLPKEEEAKNNKSHREEEKEEPPVFPKKLKERTDDEKNRSSPGDLCMGMDTGRDETVDASEPTTNSHDERSDRDNVTSDLVVKAIIEQAETHPDQFDLGRETLAKREELGGNLAVPPSAGGSDVAAEAAMNWIYHELGSEPFEKGTPTWLKELGIVGEVLRSKGVKDMVTAAEAGKQFGKANKEMPHFANIHLATFPASFGIYVGKAKKATKTAEARRARDVELTEASLAALDERKAARSQSVEDDRVGAAVKHELSFGMSSRTFETYVKPSQFVQDDGTLRVTAPDETVMGWLKGRLATTIERTAVGVTGGAMEVEFEVEE